MAAKKPATQADLLAMERRLGRRFVAIDQKFVAIDPKFVAIDQKFVAIDQRFVAVDQRFVAIDRKFDSLQDDLRATEKRLDQKIDRVAVELVRTQADVREIKETMATKDDVERILAAIDVFGKKGENYDRASVLHGRALTEVKTELKGHEKRLDILESRPT